MTNNADDDRLIGILLAIPEEEKAFGKHFDEIERSVRVGFPVTHGFINGKPVVTVQSGIGKINAALASMLLVRELNCGALIMAGVAGSLDPDLQIGDVVVGTRLIQHDYGSMIDGRIKAYQPGITPLPGLETTLGYDIDGELIERVRKSLRGYDLAPLSSATTGGSFRVPALHFGPIVSGDSFVNCPQTRDRLAFEFGALAVEMEGAAVAQVAERLNVPCLVVRGLSDLAGKRSHVDFPSFAHDVSLTVAAIVQRIVTVF